MVAVELAHGYTNRTTRAAGVVTKVYDGPDSDERQRREASALRELHGKLPVPELLASSSGRLETGFVEGAHGQDLIDAGQATAVLMECGRWLRHMQTLDSVDVVPDGDGQVLVHGDFGPNNVLLNPETLQIVAVVDWEWTHAGDPIEDLAWCEWIVRTHHPDHVDAIEAFFAAYGNRPTWAERQAAMVRKIREMIDFCHRWDQGGDAVRQWQNRLSATQTWTEL